MDGKVVYPGAAEDQKWLQSAAKTNSDEEMYHQLIQRTDSFRWHTSHGLHFNQYQGINNIRPTFKHIKEEVLNNDFYVITVDNWNQTLRASKAFFQSWARTRIKATSNGQYHDQISGKMVDYLKDTQINLREIIITKLFVDLDKLAHELSKCFAFQNNGNGSMKILIKRLSQFFHWRTALQIILKKFGKPIGEMSLYFGLNSKRILEPNSSISAFHGILTASLSYHVAKTFASQKGMVLTVGSRYPKLQHCYAFDVSPISSYPEEMIIGFMYMQIRRVSVSALHWTSKPQYYPDASQLRFMFLVVHLFKQQIFSLNESLEQIFEFLMAMSFEGLNMSIKSDVGKRWKCFLESYETSQNDMDENNVLKVRVLKLLFNKISSFAASQKVLRLDDISNGLKEYFMDYEMTNLRNESIYRLSFKKIQSIFTNVEEIHLNNFYKLDNKLLMDIINFLQTKVNGVKNVEKIKMIKFSYYNYCGDTIDESDESGYCSTNLLHKQLLYKLYNLGWKLVEKRQKHLSKEYGVIITLKLNKEEMILCGLIRAIFGYEYHIAKDIILLICCFLRTNKDLKNQ